MTRAERRRVFGFWVLDERGMLVIVSSLPAALFQFVCPSPDIWIHSWRLEGEGYS